VSDVGQQMMAVVREIDAALREPSASHETVGQDTAHGVDISLLTLLASEPFGSRLVLERLIADAHQD
jgi:hypothetical protein